jgi:hypothetical protein
VGLHDSTGNRSRLGGRVGLRAAGLGVIGVSGCVGLDDGITGRRRARERALTTAL